MKTAALGAAGAAFGLTAKSYSNILGANDRLRVAVIGLHGRAYAHLESLRACNNVAITHVCDVDRRELTKFAAAVKEKFGERPAEVKDFRQILDRMDVDAITIATPEHWHAPMAIMGLKAGKHVFVEKPCSHNPREGEILVEAQKKYGNVVQMGNQQRSSAHTIEIIYKIKNGLIGRPYFGKCWYSNTRTSIGVGKEVPVPDYLDWELWQGPAPRRQYKDNIHPYNWHWFWHWGTGETLNNGTHEVDICRWALGVEYPQHISATGGRYQFKDDWEFYDTLIANFDYGDKQITWEGMSCNGKKYFQKGRGSLIVGTTGSVLIDREGYQVFDLNDKKLEEYVVPKKNTTADLLSIDSMTDEHFKNFTDAIRKGDTLRSPVNEGNVAVTMLQLSNIAWKVGRNLSIDQRNGHIVGDDEANRYWGREYEKGWEPTT